MGYPRYTSIIPGQRGVHHCVSRCVRRAYLCGEDAVTGRSYTHRKQWLESRIVELAEVFAVAVHAYAVMSNHVHVVLEVEPGAALSWSDEETARRWLSLSCGVNPAKEPGPGKVEALAAQAERLAELRSRLGSVSWFMRYLKEPIARRANREDGCTGRFWEGAFTANHCSMSVDCWAAWCMWS